MKFCFLVPAFKARFFSEALGSILHQSYEDFEVIVSDDCSPDNLKQIVDTYDDPRVTYRRNETNIGARNLTVHWNSLLNLTTAEYIIMASDDDIFDQKYLESIDNLISNYPKAKIFRPRVRRIDGKGKIISEEAKIPQCLDLNTFVDMWSTMKIYTGIPYYVFERKSLVENGGFEDFPYAWFSDDATVIKQVSIGGIAISNDILFSFRQSPYSISSCKNIPALIGKFASAQKFFLCINNYRKALLDSTFESAIKYIQHTTKNEFIISGGSFRAVLYSWFNADYASIRWKLSLIKLWLFGR